MARQAANSLMRLRDEIRQNVTLYRRNVAELGWAIQYIGDSLVVLEEWDWTWPRGVRLARPEQRSFLSQMWQHVVTPDLRKRVGELYTLFDTGAPRLERWEHEWNGRLPLAVFLFGKLAQCEQEVCDLSDWVLDELDRLIHPSWPLPTPERR